MLDDLLDDANDALRDAQKAARGPAIRRARGAARDYDRIRDEVMGAAESVEKEIDACAAGKSKDIRKLKALVRELVDAIDALLEFTGRVQVLEDADTEAKLVTFLAVMGQLSPHAAALRKAQAEMQALRDELLRALRGAADAKIKAMVAAAVGACGLCLGPFGIGVAVTATVVVFAVDVAADAIFDGNEESNVKNAFDWASRAGDAADAVKPIHKLFGPVMLLLGMASDLDAAFDSEKHKNDVLNRIKQMDRTLKATFPPFMAQCKMIEKQGKATQAALRKAIADVRGFRPPASKFHGLYAMLK
ncbi:MAG TPA: hypothetical protein PKD10_14895 [Paracoccaceae bacterium]|nr:hypothetical protein [Paracoccaceae bacterium]HMO71285.1 hypothetical protein [Paracoccaceae bacterium]